MLHKIRSFTVSIKSMIFKIAILFIGGAKIRGNDKYFWIICIVIKIRPQVFAGEVFPIHCPLFC